jgi:signal transduction histidine kinase
MVKMTRVSHLSVRHETVNLSEMVEKIAEYLKGHYPYKRIELSVERGIVTFADHELLRIALEQILDNAWKFCAEKSGPKVVFGTRKGYGEPTFFVSDNGVGFQAEQALRLFKPFVRLGNHPELEGAGLGLAIAGRVIKRHGGRIWAEGKLGEGATIVFTLGKFHIDDK